MRFFVCLSVGFLLAMIFVLTNRTIERFVDLSAFLFFYVCSMITRYRFDIPSLKLFHKCILNQTEAYIVLCQRSRRSWGPTLGQFVYSLNSIDLIFHVCRNIYKICLRGHLLHRLNFRFRFGMIQQRLSIRIAIIKIGRSLEEMCSYTNRHIFLLVTIVHA